MKTRNLPPLDNIHLSESGDLRYLKAHLQYLAGRREFAPARWSYNVSKNQAIVIRRYAEGLVKDLRRS